MKLWIVGRIRADENPYAPTWDFQGVFDSEESADRACVSDDYFIGPATLNDALPETRESWPGCYFPRLRKNNIT